MYKIKSALCVFLMFNSMHVPALHRFMSTMPRLMTFSSASKALSKSHVPVNRIIPIRMGQAPKLTTQPQLLLKPTQFQKHAHIKHQKFNWNRARNISCLVGTGAALLALHNTRAKAEGNEQEKEKQALEPYRNPYEKQRKKYYEELLAKPWGAVSKKYIDALEAEEKELVKEFFELTGMNEEQLNKLKLAVAIYEENWIKKEKQNYLQQYPEDYKKVILDVFKNGVAVLLEKYGLKNIEIMVDRNWDDVGISFPGNMFVFGRFFKEQFQKSDFGYWCFSQEMADRLILHEIQHILHRDVFMIKVLVEGLIQKTSKERSFFLKYRIFQEKRADILAGLNDPLIALAGSHYFLKSGFIDVPINYAIFVPLIIFATRVLNKPVANFFSCSSEHPNLADRINYFTQLHQEMLEALEKKTKMKPAKS